MGLTRRDFLYGIGGVTSSFVTRKAFGATKSFSPHENSVGVLHDITRCIGCRKCEDACHQVNHLPDPKLSFSDLSVLNTVRRTHSDVYTVVNRFEVNGQSVFVKKQCNHCLEPACASACFVKAFKKEITGPVIYKESLCVGCRYCMIACPFNIPAYEYHNPFSPKVTKCTLCSDRLNQGLLPGCVDICPKEALVFGTRQHLINIARQRIDEHPERYIDHIYGEHEMGGTSWLYISGVKFSDIGMREDLGTISAPALTAGPLSAVPIVVGLWPVLLTGMYAISKRKEKIAEAEKAEAVKKAQRIMQEQMETKIAEVKSKSEKEKEAAIQKAVKQAVAGAEKKFQSEKSEIEEAKS
ncbi:MAG: 4Fe-4S dicluster domain-containing protein [Desulfobacterales bacterium]|nr:4Fe-4S dicluster domain-containing protein [Desulfobacterales bacterium]